MTRKINLLVTQLLQHYDGEYAPNVECAWDEPGLEQNPEGWAEAVAKTQKLVGSEYENVAVVCVSVDAEKFDAAPETPKPELPAAFISLSEYGFRLLVAGCTGGGDEWTQIVDVWDEYTLEENGEGFVEKFTKLAGEVGTTYVWMKVVDLYLPSSVINDALAPWRNVHPVTIYAVPRPAAV
jgi:hypothetical protein